MQELKKIKTIQVHRGGGLILSMDYSTLEVRIFCAICGDPLLKEVLNSGKDLHCQTARAIFPQLKDLSDKEIKEHHNGLRSKAKSCFVAGTKVLMSNNSTKNIEDIKIGDVVVSREEFTGKLILSRVRHSGETNRVKELVELQLSNSTTLRCTPDHKIRLKNGKYKEAKYIVIQDIVDSEFSIISISHIQLTEAIPVYDIEVENESNSHNFCANGVFVHNCIFGLLYGKSTFNFAKEWGCTVDEAQAVLDGLMGAYPAIKTYVAAQHEFAKKNGYVVNMFGQKRPLPGAQLPEFGPTKKQFRHAMNAAQNCFVGDTKINLLDGTTMTFKEVVDAYKEKDLYVYSVEKNGHIIPGKIIAAAQTKIVDELAHVTLDNGEVIKCTVDHKFIMRNGERKEAGLLKTGDSVMPLYKHLNTKGYVVYKDNLDNKQKQVYDMVYTYYKGEKLPNNNIHHINRIKIDNTPNNLLQVTFSEHCRIHGKEDMSKRNHTRSVKYTEWDHNQREALKRETKKRVEIYGNCLGVTKENYSRIARNNINSIWKGSDEKKKLYMKQNIKNCGTNTSFFKFKKHTLKMINENLITKEDVLKDSFAEVWNNYRLHCGKRLSSIPKYTEELHKRLIEYLFNNHKIVSVEIIKCEPTPVYNIEIENHEDTHNYALSSGVFVSNSPIQSSSSIMAWIAGAHVQEEFCLQNMQSVMIGGVHDSTYVDVYPKELIKCMKIFNFHAEVAANKIHNWMNGVYLPADFGLGQSWGRELDVKKWELHDGNMCQLILKGGDVNWEYLKRELDEAYDYKVVSIEDGDAITEEEHENIPVRQSNKYVTVTLDFIDPDPNIEYKSKYYVGNGTFGKRVDTRENPIKSLL